MNRPLPLCSAVVPYCSTDKQHLTHSCQIECCFCSTVDFFCSTVDFSVARCFSRYQQNIRTQQSRSHPRNIRGKTGSHWHKPDHTGTNRVTLAQTGSHWQKPDRTGSHSFVIKTSRHRHVTATPTTRGFVVIKLFTNCS